MGTDIYGYTGVFCGIDNMVNFVTGKTRFRVIELCNDFYESLEAEADKAGEGSWEQSQFETFAALKACVIKEGPKGKTMMPKLTLAELRDLLKRTVKISGEPGDYNMDTHVVNGDELRILFDEILEVYKEVYGVNLPYFEEVKAFGSARYNGDSVPLGEACFIFSEDDCYEKQLSAEGKNLKKVIKHVDTTQYTIFSC